jgi:hypothetical protein
MHSWHDATPATHTACVWVTEGTLGWNVVVIDVGTVTDDVVNDVGGAGVVKGSDRGVAGDGVKDIAGAAVVVGADIVTTFLQHEHDGLRDVWWKSLGLVWISHVVCVREYSKP